MHGVPRDARTCASGLLSSHGKQLRTLSALQEGKTAPSAVTAEIKTSFPRPCAAGALVDTLAPGGMRQFRDLTRAFARQVLAGVRERRQSAFVQPIVAACCAIGCAGGEPHPSTGAHQQPIIDGAPAPELSSVVLIAHRDVSDVCSGVLVAPRLVVTAKHCTLAPNTGTALVENGFRVGFGADIAALLERYSVAVHRLGSLDAGASEGGLTETVSAGEDVASIVLTEDAPSGALPSALAPDYQPNGTDLITWAGFGISSLSTGLNGTRLEASGKVTGLDPTTGMVQVAGPSACFGDSGGPLLLEPNGLLVGIISSVGGSSDASFCDIGLTFASTLANANVRSFLLAECAAQGGCGHRLLNDGGVDAVEAGAGLADADSGGVDEASVQVRDAGPDAEGSIAQVSPADGGCSCHAARRSTSSIGAYWFAIALLARRGRDWSRRHSRRIAWGARAFVLKLCFPERPPCD